MLCCVWPHPDDSPVEWNVSAIRCSDGKVAAPDTTKLSLLPLKLQWTGYLCMYIYIIYTYIHTYICIYTVHICIYNVYIYIYITNKTTLISGCLCVCVWRQTPKSHMMWSNPFRASLMLLSVQNLTTQFKVVIYKKKQTQKKQTLRVEMVKRV